MTQLIRFIVITLAFLAVAPVSADSGAIATTASDRVVASNHGGQLLPSIACDRDQLWLISTRHLPFNACSAELNHPNLDIRRVDCGRTTRADLSEFQVRPPRPLIVYVHGNRMESSKLLERALTVYRHTRRCRSGPSVDWVIWSWPSEKDGILLDDARKKAKRTDAQALYLAWFLANQTDASTPLGMIGYSYGCRIISGALHTLAGGPAGGRTLPGEPRLNLQTRVGFVAPAMDARAMSRCGIYSRATQNMSELALLYNGRDVVLKNFWKVSRDRSTMALGFSGPTSFAPRFDGSQLPVRSRNCTRFIGLRHVELDYYEKQCRAGNDMSHLISELGEIHQREVFQVADANASAQ